MLVCPKKKRNGSAHADQGVSTASQDSCRMLSLRHSSTSPYPTFLLALQNGLRQLITCGQKLHDEYTPVVKGLIGGQIGPI